MPDRDSTTRVLAYLRVSTRDQQENGHGLDAQRAAIARYCEFRGYTIVDEVEESESAKTMARPGMRACLERIRAGEADGLIVSKLDRLTRNPRDFIETVELFHRRGWQLVMVEPEVDLRTPGGLLLAQVMSAFAGYERAMISDRTKQGLAAARAKGIRLGAAREVSDDAETVIRELFAQGLGRRGIAEELDRRGVATPRGGSWSPETVRRSLDRQGLKRPRGRVTGRKMHHA